MAHAQEFRLWIIVTDFMSVSHLRINDLYWDDSVTPEEKGLKIVPYQTIKKTMVWAS